MSKIMLCTDSVSVRYPECIGLDGEALQAQEWMQVLTDAGQARIHVRNQGAGDTEEVWVAGSDTVDAINLAAALKREGPAHKVCLVAFQGSGSLYSRAQAAGIDEVWDKSAFVSHYRSAKGAHCKITPIADLRSGQDVSGAAALDPLANAAPAYTQPAHTVAIYTQPSHTVPDPLADAAPTHTVPARIESFETLPTTPDPRDTASATIEPYVPSAASALALEPQNLDAVSEQSNNGTQNQHKERGILLPIMGAGGGVGKSTVAVVAAYLAQSRGYRTVLVDADLQFGDIAYLTGADNALPIDEVASNTARLQALDSAGNTPAILAAPGRLEHSETVAAQLPMLIDSLRQRFDVVVVNTSPAWSDVQLSLLEAGGKGIFLLDQRPSSIRACKHALELCARCGIATQPLVFALNRCSRTSLFSSIDVTCALQGAHVVELAEGGRDVEELLGTGAPGELVACGNALCQSVGSLLDEVLPTQSVAPVLEMPSRKRFWFGARRKKAACL